MNRNKAAAVVAVAFSSVKFTRDAKSKVNPKAKTSGTVAEAIADPSVTGFEVTVEGHEPIPYKFKYGAHAHEQRKHEIAELKLRLISELEKQAEPMLKKAEADAEKDEKPAAKA